MNNNNSNNDNNNNNFNPIAVQPTQQDADMNQSIQTNNMIQQSVQNQQYQSPTNQKNNNNSLKVIIIIIVLIALGIGVFYFINHAKSDETPNVTENNNSTSNNSSDNNTSSDNASSTVGDNINTTYDENGAFLMNIEDVLTIYGRGTVANGRITRGKVKVGDTVQVIGLNREIRTVKVVDIKSFRESLNEAKVGDTVGVLLADLSRDEVEKGQVLAQPNSIIASDKFEAKIHLLTTVEGGRTKPVSTNYEVKFFFRTIVITGIMNLTNGKDMVNPGDSAEISVELTSSVAMEIGTEFSICEGGKVIGTGTITKVK